MHSTIHAARLGHLSRHERLRIARAEVFSRRTPAVLPLAVTVKLADEELQLIDRLICRDRTPVSTALLAIVGIGAGQPIRAAVLAQVREADAGRRPTARSAPSAAVRSPAT